jgi:DNA (cytosine-5)-methyltransferase 1
MNEELRTMHLFAGAGGGILADLILGHRPIVAVEWDKYACEVLRARAADGWFDGMSVWEGDVRLFDPSDYKGRVDCIHAGFPCQDISSSGRRSGVGENTRSGLYREVLRIADVLQPGYLFLENVSAIVSGDDGSMLRTVVGDLADRGYDCVWRCVSASQVGARHKRDRWWLLAYPNSFRHDWRDSTRYATQEQSVFSGEQERRTMECEAQGRSALRGEKDVADSNGAREQIGVSESAKRKERHSEVTNNGSDRRHGWARQGYWSVEPAVGRVVDGMADRTHRIKALGNGQVPLQCATAFKILWEEHNVIKATSRKGRSDVKGISG